MMFKVVIAVACLVAVTLALPPVDGVYGGGNPNGYGGQGNPGGYGGQGNPGGYGGQGNPGGFGGQGGAGGQGGGFGGKPVRPPCDTPGVASCSDCLTRSMCTFVGQIITECSGTTPYCNEGLCSATPSVECNEPVPIAA